MQNTSPLYRRIVANPNHYFETTVVIGESGDLVTEYGDKILFGGTAILVARTGPDSGFRESKIFSVKTSSKLFGNDPEIGTAISQEIELQMLQPAGDIPEMSQVVVYVKAAGDIQREDGWIITDGAMTFFGGVTTENSILTFSPEFGAKTEKSIIILPSNTEFAESEWLQQGIFYIDTRETTASHDSLKVLTLHGFDAMMMAEQYWHDNGSLNWSTGTVSDVAMVNDIASIMDISVDERTYDIMTNAYQIPMPMQYTLREILGYIASMYAGCFIITEVGQLRLVSLLELPPETNLLIDNIGDYIVFGRDRIIV